MRRRARPRAKPSSTTNIILVIVGVGILGIGLFALSRGGGDDLEISAAPAQPAPKKTDPHAERRNAAQWWYDEAFFDEMGRAKRLPGDKIVALFAEAEKRGYASIPKIQWEAKKKKVYKLLLDREPHHPEANRAMGRKPLVDYPDFFAAWRRLTDARALPPDLRKLRDDYEEKITQWPKKKAPAVSAEEFARVSELLRDFDALNEKFSKDPVYKAIFDARARIAIDPILGKYETVHVQVGPYVLFYASKDLKNDNPKLAAELTQRLESFRTLIEAYLRYFKKNWMEPLGLADFKKDQVFFVWVFGDRPSWEHYARAMGRQAPPGLLGYFSPETHRVYLYEDRKDRVKVESSLAHELTHQLHWHFSKDAESEFHNHLTRIKAPWFEEGWAEYAGWTKKGPAGYQFGQNSVERMRVIRMMRKNELPLYPLQQMVQRKNYLDWLKVVIHDWLPKKVRLPNDKKKIAALVAVYFDLLYSQGWLFQKFLYEFEGGKYKAKNMKFVKAALKGFMGYRGKRGYAQAHEVFAEILGLKTKADWTRLQKEFNRYIETKMYEIPLK